MRFEWDDSKAESNFKKHGVTFVESKKAFADEFGLEIFDESHSTFEEQRFIRIGLVNEVLFVVFNVVDEIAETFRIISARKADKYYESIYWNQRAGNK